ncbi:IS21-like element helper ATPase IstB [Deferribacter autotrophicus]|uniref:IS21-like element helper ATPase IstB n=1 Tax=Deferribacter autotrophicus TaxID=500465 RepID=UPI001CAA8418|nr:IS21-like element helper ATPase IstB [Deferribacter autotrophicus]
MQDILKKLTNFKLSGMAKTLESRNQYAIENSLSYLDFLELLLDDESVNRQNNSFKRRFSKSKLDSSKTLPMYDFTYQPELNKQEILDISSCRFIEEKKNIIFMGNPGVGKTHLANAIGLEALKKGYKVLFIHANDMVSKLVSSKGDGSYFSVLKQFLSVDLLIIDEVGFKKIPLNHVDEFFEIIRHRYENNSIIITTNRPFEEWGNIFGDVVLASAIIDRLVHHAHIFRINGESYRIKSLQSMKNTKR